MDQPLTSLNVMSSPELQRGDIDSPLSYEHLHALLFQSPAAMAVVHGREHVFTLANPLYQKLFGRTEAQLLGKTIRQVWPEVEDQGIWELFDAVFLSGEPFIAHEYEARFKDNGLEKTGYYDFTAQPIKNARGEVIDILIHAMEVTGQVVSRKAVEESEHRFRQVVANAPEPISLYTGENLVLEDANEASLRIFGAGREILGKPLLQIAPELEAQGFARQMLEVYKSGISCTSQEVPAMLFHGSKPVQFYFNYTFQPFTRADGTVSGVLVTATDVTSLVEGRKKVEESEAKLAFAIEGGELGTFDFFPLTGTLHWSARNKELFGLRADAEVDYDSYLKGLHPDDRERSNDIVQNLMQPESGGLYENEYRTIGIEDGKIRWVRSKGKIIFDEDGKPVRFTGITQDITAQKEAQAALQLQSLVLEQMDEGVSISNEEGIILMTNPAEDRIFGYERGELIGKHVSEQNAYSPEENDRIVSAVMAELRDKGAWTGEWQNRRKDGTSFFTHSYITTLRSGGGSYFVCVQRDITQEKQALEALQASEQQFRLMADAIPEIVWVSDAEGRSEFFNKRWEEFSGQPFQPSTANQVANEFLHPDDAPIVMAAFQRSLQTGEPMEVEQRNRSASGAYRWFLNRARPYRDPLTGEIRKWFGIGIDIHERKGIQEALKESQTNLSFALEATELGTWDMNPATNTYKGNQRFKEWFGLPPDDDMPISLALEAIWEKDRDRVTGAIQAALEYSSGGQYDITYTVIPPGTGRERIVRARGKTSFNSEGVACRFDGTMQDVTEQVRARKKLEESEKELQRLFADAPAGIAILKGKELRYVMANDFYLAFFNRTRDQLLGKTMGEAFPELQRTDLEKVRELLRSGQTWRHSEYAVFLDIEQTGMPKLYYYDFTMKPLRNEEGRLDQLLVVLYDVTSSVLARQKLAESESRFRTLAETLPELVWMTDDRGRLEFASSKWKAFAGIEPSGTDAWMPIIHPDDKNGMALAWTKSLSSGRFQPCEVRLKNIKGDYVWHYVQGESIRDEQDRIHKWIGSFTNIQSQKDIASELERRVEERTGQLAEANRELQRSNEDLQQFAHVASHDLKEPVRKVMTFTNRLKTELGRQLPEQAHLYLSKIESSGIRMYSMIDGVLLYSSLNALEQTKELVDLDELIHTIQADLEVPMAQKKGQIIMEDLPAVEGSPVLMYQLFYNLINNSLKFARPSIPPCIRISGEVLQTASDATGNDHPRHGLIKLVLRDNGIGFDASQGEKIFGAFTRLHSKDRYEGTGLGLSLCKKIVERHGGTISATGKEGEGAIFTIHFPA
ncbi:MAG TPA: PAS domain S-box protein [Flavisolibacter sp.]|nr:PAS domain S-box protein [Flavisolibacter sp.]